MLMSKRIFDDFDKYAKNYRTVHNENLKITGASSEYFAELKVFEIKQTEKDIPLLVLDVGCGDGLSEFYFRKHFPTSRLEGIDVSEESIYEAKAKGISNAGFTVFNGMNIPFQSNVFDLVIVASVLHHIRFDYHLLLVNEIRRVLKMGGRLYLFEHNPVNPMTKYIVKTCEFDKDAKLLKFSYTEKLLKKAGFKIARRAFLLFFPRTRVFRPLVRLEKFLYWFPLGGQYMYRCIK